VRTLYISYLDHTPRPIHSCVHLRAFLPVPCTSPDISIVVSTYSLQVFATYPLPLCPPTSRGSRRRRPITQSVIYHRLGVISCTTFTTKSHHYSKFSPYAGPGTSSVSIIIPLCRSSPLSPPIVTHTHLPLVTLNLTTFDTPTKRTFGLRSRQSETWVTSRFNHPRWRCLSTLVDRLFKATRPFPSRLYLLSEKIVTKLKINNTKETIVASLFTRHTHRVARHIRHIQLRRVMDEWAFSHREVQAWPVNGERMRGKATTSIRLANRDW